MPSKELKLPDRGEREKKNKTSSAGGTARQARAVRRERGRRAGAQGPRRGPSGATSWRSLVCGNVIVYQFSTTSKAPYCDGPVSYENQTMIPQS